MKFTLSWLKEYLETEKTVTPLAEKLTALGLEIESVTDRSVPLAAFKVAEIREASPHPAADKLRVCRVFDGEQLLQVVCGAPNARAGIKVVLAPIGAVVPTNGMKIKASQIRGVDSQGMLCSASELGLGIDGDGIIELPAHVVPGASFVATMGLDDPVVEVSITPNRGDCLGVYGIARDLAASKEGQLKALSFHKIDAKEASLIKAATADNVACPFFAGRTITGVKNGQSPEWLKRRLEAIGKQPISLIVDITNYVMLTTGQPLHAYDQAKLKGTTLTARSAVASESIVALDHKTYALLPGMTVIADSERPVAIAGLMGGELTGCSERTNTVFLEAAWFDPASIAHTGRALQLHTDARYRFERHVDPHMTQKALDMATALIVELAGGKASDVTVAGTITEARTLTFRLKLLETIGGVALSADAVAGYLEGIGCVITARTNDILTLTLPSWRPDITQEVDIVEEVLRLYGYDQLPVLPLEVPAQIAPALSPLQRRVGSARRLLAARGYLEAVTFSFMEQKLAEHFGGGDASLQLQNPISVELSTMRPSLLPHLLKGVVENARRGVVDLAFFEIGPVFHGVTPDKQAQMIGGLRSGFSDPRNMYGKQRSVDVFDIKADVLALLREMGAPVDRLTLTPQAPKWYHPGRSGTYKLGQTVIAYIGEVHPGILREMECDHSVVAFELFPAAVPLGKSKQGRKAAWNASVYQPVVRDFAFIVDKDVPVEQVVRMAKNADKQLVTQAELFDIYAGKGIEEGKKSVAISVTFQANDRTLVDEEIEILCGKVVVEVNRVGGVLRE